MSVAEGCWEAGDHMLSGVSKSAAFTKSCKQKGAAALASAPFAPTHVLVAVRESIDCTTVAPKILFFHIFDALSRS
jgi:hypothetical protein